MEMFWQDIRYGVRMLLKAPSISIVATIALALGIGANTAIFSVVNAVLLRPLPFANSEQLMNVWETDSVRGYIRGSASYPNFVDWREQNHVFEHISIVSQQRFHNDRPGRINAAAGRGGQCRSVSVAGRVAGDWTWISSRRRQSRREWSCCRLKPGTFSEAVQLRSEHREPIDGA